MIRSPGAVLLLALIACVRPQQFGHDGVAGRGVAGGDVTVYELSAAEVPLGDYGSILVHGMSLHLGRLDGRIQLERTGPFVPPVTLPGLSDVIVTDTARRALERAVPGLSFRPVVKARVVRIEWEGWDRAADEPAEYPSSGEPEDYILEHPHDDALAEKLGPLWEVVPAVVPTIQLEGGRINDAAYDGQDLVRANALAGHNFVSPRLMKALAAVGEGWIAFRPVR